MASLTVREKQKKIQKRNDRIKLMIEEEQGKI